MKIVASSMPRLASALVVASSVGLACSSLAIAQIPVSGGESALKSDQPVTDTWITTQVKADLATTNGVKSADISVTTLDGIVTLTGSQTTQSALVKAVVAAEIVKGVKSVDSTGLKVKL